MNEVLLRRFLLIAEGYRLKPYDDKTGKEVVLATGGNITIGIGWNLTANGLPAEVVDLLYRLSVERVCTELDAGLAWWRKLDDVRQVVLASMAFNMGTPVLLMFHDFLNLMSAGSFTAAAQDLRRTKLYQQLPGRTERLAVMIETGQEPT